MPGFCAVFNVQTVLTKRKTNLFTVFPQLLKIMANKALKTFEREKGKVKSG